MSFLGDIAASLLGGRSGRRGRGDDMVALDYHEGGSLSSPSGWLVRQFAPRTKAGPSVSELTARHLPVVYACINRIGNPISQFPVRMYRSRPDGSRVLVKPSEHPFAALVNLRPNAFMSSRTVRKTISGHALLWGNGYLEIERNRRGQGVGLYPLLPNATRPDKQGGVLTYRTTIDGKNHNIPQDDVIHLMDQSQDGYIGISQIAMARQAVGHGLAMEEFGSKFFANDAKSGGFLMHPGRLSSNARQNLRGRDGEVKAAPESPKAAIEAQSGLDNAHRVKILEEGMKFIQTTIPPEDAQFVGSREFNIAEIARIYDVPLILLQSQEKQTSYGSGIEQLMIGFVRQTIAPWINAWEQELNWKLFTEEEREEGLYVSFNMNALLRGDMKARSQFYKDMFSVGGFSPNMILAYEDEDGIGDVGDFHFVPANMVTLERATDPKYEPAGATGAEPVQPTDTSAVDPTEEDEE